MAPKLKVTQPPPTPVALHTASTAAPDAQSLYAAAKQQADRHELDAALLGLDAALQQNPLLAPAHYLHGLILQERGHAAAALEAWRRCVYADPRFVLGHYALGSLLARQGQTDRARKSLENVARLLDGRPRDELIPDGDSLTVGGLMELVLLHKDL
jgi:chemotaxis protein methyltransferase CheR